MYVKRGWFDKFTDHSLKLLRVGTEKFLRTFPEPKLEFYNGDSKIDIVNKCIIIAMTAPK